MEANAASSFTNQIIPKPNALFMWVIAPVAAEETAWRRLLDQLDDVGDLTKLVIALKARDAPVSEQTQRCEWLRDESLGQH